ncbi:MAG: hypothetical protein ACC657_09800 [Thiohalomonadales bacterium]
MCVKEYPLIFSKDSRRLVNENQYFQNTGGVSEENRGYHFIPAFLDFESGKTYVSSFSNGDPAPIHIYDGLPKHLILSRNDANKPMKIKQSVISGFVFENCFYTREQAKQLVAHIENTY